MRAIKVVNNSVIFLFLLGFTIVLINYFKLKSENSNLKEKIEAEYQNIIIRKEAEIKNITEKNLVYDSLIVKLESDKIRYFKKIDSLDMIYKKNQIYYKQKIEEIKKISSSALLEFWKEKFKNYEEFNN